MLRMIRALLDGLLGRCPRCHGGGMFERGLTIRPVCRHCGLRFETASGEITGGMGINITLTLVIVIILAAYFGMNPAIPLGPLLFGLGAFAVLFPILFYRPARGIWIALLFLTGNTSEGDS